MDPKPVLREGIGMDEVLRGSLMRFKMSHILFFSIFFIFWTKVGVELDDQVPSEVRILLIKGP